MATIVTGKNPRKPHTVRYQDAGRQRERSFATSREARDFKIKFEHDSRQQIFVDPRLSGQRFADAAEAWVASPPAPTGRYYFDGASRRTVVRWFRKGCDLAGLPASFTTVCNLTGMPCLLP